MILTLVNKFLVVLYLMSFLTLVRHGYYFLQAYFKSTEEEPAKYKITNRDLTILCIALGYLLSAIFVGITIK